MRSTNSANARAAFGGGDWDVSAAKSGVPVREAQPECLLRISSAWELVVSYIIWVFRGEGGGILC